MDINCPYCENELNICHDDGQGYEEGINHKMECSHCKKNFVFQTSISYYYEPYKADCLNDEEHEYELTNTRPTPFSRMQCTMCGDERELTEEERIKHSIPTKEEYFNSLKNNKDAY